MALEHVNRRGDHYYLQSKPTKTGKTKYYFGRKLSGDPVTTVPEGFEVYESPDDAQVVLRKTRENLILPIEREMTSNAIRRLTGMKHFVVEMDGGSLVVWTADVSDADLHLERVFGMGRSEMVREMMMARARYSKMLRFSLVDPAKRLFYAERWCFLGSIDNWFHLSGAAPLMKHLERYVPHLWKESFFELM